MNLKNVTLMAAIMLFCGCQSRDSDELQIDEINDLDAILLSINQNRISPDISTLQSEDAAKVALNFYNGQIGTKASSVEVKSVIPIYGVSKDVVLYAVNLTDGYVLVSSSKDTYPIYGYAEYGEFKGKDTGTGLDVILSEYKLSDESADPSLSFNDLWSRYEQVSALPKITTRADIPSDYYDLLNQYLGDWFSNGYSVNYLYDQPDGMPDELYESFCQDAELEMGGMSQYPYMDCAIITYKTTSTRNEIYPMLSTKWDQDSPYNDSDPQRRHLGCTTIAAGQIMHFYQYPLKYPDSDIIIRWNLMPNNTSNSFLAEFLLRLKNDIGVDDYGNAKLDNLNSAIRHYGYTTEIIKHNGSRVYSELYRGRPVCMTGLKSDGGHAWVCDGFYSSIETTEYNLFIVRYEAGVPSSMIQFNRQLEYNNGPSFFHMNWGWGGTSDGYFLDNRIAVPNGDYSTDRKDILIRK